VSLVDPFRAVAFDMDGVLVDSFQSWWLLLNDLLESEGKRKVTREEFREGWGQDQEADRRQFFPEWSVERLTREYAERFPRYRTFVVVELDAVRVLEALRARRKRLAVATNSPSGIATHLLEGAGIDRHFDRIVGVDQVAQVGKPAPDLLDHIGRSLEVTSAEMCYVGDTDYDAEAARAAGVFFIGYRREGDARIERLGDLLNGEWTRASTARAAGSPR
jgi:phosphoglycolate phosphatase